MGPGTHGLAREAAAMIRTLEAAQELLRAFEKRSPGAFALARSVSLAARVEPELLRSVRLRLFPQLTAADEADFWLSPLIEAQGPLWVLLEPRVAEELRRDLTDRCDGAMRRQLQELIAVAHEQVAPLVKLEEKVHWLSLTANNRRAVEESLAPILQTLRDNSESGVAQWAARTIPRFSSWIRDLPIAWAIRVVAEQRLGGAVSLGASGAAGMPDEAATLLRHLLPTTDVWVRLTGESLEFSRQRLLGAHRIAVPMTEPIALEVMDEEERPRSVEVRRALQRVPSRGRTRIRTLTGVQWELEPVASSPQSHVTFRFAVAPRRHGDDLVPGDPHVVFVRDVGPIRRLAEAPLSEPSALSDRFDPIRHSRAVKTPHDPLEILVSAGNREDESWLELAARQRQLFGEHAFTTGSNAGDFATTVEVDGALVGIVAINTSARGTYPKLDAEQLSRACGGLIDEWVARHHAAILIFPDFERVAVDEIVPHVQRWGFTLVIHGGDFAVQVGPVLGLRLATEGLVGELRIGMPSLLRVYGGKKPIHERRVITQLHPIEMQVAEPRRWVLIAGSGSRYDAFTESVARAIGQELAREGIGLITGGWRGVDEIVALAYAEVMRTRGAAALTRCVTHVLGTIQPRAEVPGDRMLLATDERAVVESVRMADAVLLISGFGGTAWIAEEARKQEKRVIPVPQTGGIAASVAEQGPSADWWRVWSPDAIARAAVATITQVDHSPAMTEPFREGVRFGEMMIERGAATLPPKATTRTKASKHPRLQSKTSGGGNRTAASKRSSTKAGSSKRSSSSSKSSASKKPARSSSRSSVSSSKSSGSSRKRFVSKTSTKKK